MVCNGSSINKSAAGASLAETIVAVAIGSLVLLAICSLSMYSARSIAGIGNYVDLDAQGRSALDRMSKEIRGADKLVYYDTNQLTFQINSTTNQLSFRYTPSTKILTRALNGVRTDDLLTECDYLRFDIYQNDATNALFGVLLSATTN